MDKVDVVLFRYKRERSLSKEFKRQILCILSPMVIAWLGYVFSLIFCPDNYKGGILFGYIIFIVIWTKVSEGKCGTRKWKYKLMTIYKARFKMDQSQLVAIIQEEGMNCQQVYNILIKKHNRLPQSADKSNFIITILSLIVALVGILVSPLQGANIKSYEEYVIYVIAISLFLLPIGYVIYKFVAAQSKQYDEKKNYEYVVELLEDYLY